MPQHEIHYNIDDLLIGFKCPEVHQIMDIFSKEGPNHRRVFHTNQTVFDVLESTGSLESAWSTVYHLVADRTIREGEHTQELPDNVRKESIIAEMFDLMARGEVPIVLFPNSVLSRLICAIQDGTAQIVDPQDLPNLKETYYIKR
jgi:hypothetical protein